MLRAPLTKVTLALTFGYLSYAELQPLLHLTRTWRTWSEPCTIRNPTISTRQTNGAVDNSYIFAQTVCSDRGHTRLCHLHQASLAKMKLTTSSRSQGHAELQLLLLIGRTWQTWCEPRTIRNSTISTRQTNGTVGNSYTFAESVCLDCERTRLCFGEELHVLRSLLVLGRICCSCCSATENIICQVNQYTNQKTVSRICLSVLHLLCVFSMLPPRRVRFRSPPPRR